MHTISSSCRHVLCSDTCGSALASKWEPSASVSTELLHNSTFPRGLSRHTSFSTFCNHKELTSFQTLPNPKDTCNRSASPFTNFHHQQIRERYYFLSRIYLGVYYYCYCYRYPVDLKEIAISGHRCAAKGSLNGLELFDGQSSWPTTLCQTTTRLACRPCFVSDESVSSF